MYIYVNRDVGETVRETENPEFIPQQVFESSNQNSFLSSCLYQTACFLLSSKPGVPNHRVADQHRAVDHLVSGRKETNTFLILYIS